MNQDNIINSLDRVIQGLFQILAELILAIIIQISLIVNTIIICRYLHSNISTDLIDYAPNIVYSVVPPQVLATVFLFGILFAFYISHIIIKEFSTNYYPELTKTTIIYWLILTIPILVIFEWLMY